MQPFKFSSAQSVEEAVKSGGRFLAGGTALLDLMKLHVETPSLIVDVSELPLKTIDDRGSSVWIGSLVTNADLAASAVIKNQFPVLSQALLAGASPQLRNQATLGGNILQRTRCAYFRDLASACNKREPNSGCSAIGGVSRMHAILGVSDSCIAANPSDMCVALSCLDAVVHVRSSAGADRTIAFSDFHREPGRTPEIETVLTAGDFIRGIELKKEERVSKQAYLKVRDRASYAFALTSAAVRLELREGKIASARVSLGGVGTKPWRTAAVEAKLLGHPLTLSVLQAAAAEATAGAKATRENKFKITLIQKTIVRALEQAGGLV